MSIVLIINILNYKYINNLRIFRRFRQHVLLLFFLNPWATFLNDKNVQAILKMCLQVSNNEKADLRFKTIILM